MSVPRPRADSRPGFGAEAGAELAWRQAGGLAKRVGEVGLIGVEIEVVGAKRALQTQDLQQVTRSKSGRLAYGALELTRREARLVSHVGYRHHSLWVTQNSRHHRVWAYQSVRAEPVHERRERRCLHVEVLPLKGCTDVMQGEYTPVRLPYVVVDDLVPRPAPCAGNELYPTRPTRDKVDRRWATVTAGGSIPSWATNLQPRGFEACAISGRWVSARRRAAGPPPRGRVRSRARFEPSVPFLGRTAPDARPSTPHARRSSPPCVERSS